MLDVLGGYGQKVILFPEFLVDLIIDLSDVALIRIFLCLVNLLSGNREPLIGLFRGIVRPSQEFLVAGLGGHFILLKGILGGRLVVMLPAFVESFLRAMHWELSTSIDKLFVIIVVGVSLKMGLHVRFADFILLIDQTIINLIVSSKGC